MNARSYGKNGIDCQMIPILMEKGLKAPGTGHICSKISILLVESGRVFKGGKVSEKFSITNRTEP